jgi:hypothetical protein
LKFTETVEKIDNSNAKPRENTALKAIRVVVKNCIFNQSRCTNGFGIQSQFPIVSGTFVSTMSFNAEETILENQIY